MTTRTLAELEKECKKLGILDQVQAKKTKISKQDYIDVLAKFNLEKRYGTSNLSEIPQSLRFRLMLQSPMLAYQYTRLKPEEQKNIWTSDQWIFTEKENGVRMMLMYTPKEGLHLYSRNISVDDYQPK